MTSPVTTVGPDLPLADVLQIIERRGVSSVPVVAATGHLLGIVSTTDLVRAMARTMTERDAGPLFTRDVMRTPVLVVGAEEGLLGAARRMVEHHVHRLVVIDRDLPVGVLSARDVLEAFRDTKLDAPLSRFMTAPVATVSLGEGIDEATAKLAQARVHGLVVVDGATPVGVFTQAEALAARHLPPPLRTRPVEGVMSYEVVLLDATTPVHRAFGYVAALDVRRILVTRDGTLVGILGVVDLVRALLE